MNNRNFKFILHRPRPVVLVIIGLALFCAVFNFLPRISTGFAEFYAETIYPVWVFIVSGITSFLPFSLLEWAIYILIPLAVFGLVFIIIKAVKNKPRRGAIIKRAVCVVLVFIFSLLTVLTLNCSINYFRIPFSEKSQLNYAGGYTVAELKGTLKNLVIEANLLVDDAPKGDDSLLDLSQVDINKVSRDAMTNLGKIYPSLSGYYPNPKSIFFSEALSTVRLCGFYSPFTIEANYNKNIPPYTLPFTICHELSHLKGFMREDEANYIAYLACVKSDNTAFKYSGYVEAITYSLNALYGKCDNEEYYEILYSIDERIINEITAKNNYWKNYESKVAEVYNTVNDTYLKIQAQSDGVKSYGRFVDLLIYEWKNKQ